MHPRADEFSLVTVAVVSRICSRPANEYGRVPQANRRKRTDQTQPTLEIAMKLATIVSSILATSFIALGGAAVPQVAAASPNDGVRCPAGYEGRFANGALTCTKLVVDDISNTAGKECTLDQPFVNFQRMALGQRDICLSPDVTIASNGSLADLENGRVVVRIPVGRALPPRLAGRPVKTIGGFQIVEINPNADFIFYDQSKTMQKDVSIAGAKAIIRERTSTHLAGSELELGGTSVRTTPDANGSLDKVEATVTVFAFAQH